MTGKVYIIGAGPGDYKLLTLKAVEAIKKSDVIIYDRLIDSKVLSFADHSAEFVYVGKQPDYHPVPQEEINKILLKYASVGKTVARLKGGDPFLFGRGGEECDYLHKNGIEYEVVPGITSASTRLRRNSRNTQGTCFITSYNNRAPIIRKRKCRKPGKCISV